MQGVGVWGMTIFKQFVCQQWAIPSNAIRSLRSSFSNSRGSSTQGFQVFRLFWFSDQRPEGSGFRVENHVVEKEKEKFKISKKNYSEIYHDLQGLVCDKRKKRS